MFTVFVKGMGLDEDFCWENEYPYFGRQRDAEKFARELEENYKDEGWKGHKYYNRKFYVGAVSESYIEQKQHQWALLMASMV